MIMPSLFIDIRNDTVAFALVGAKDSRWVAARAEREFGATMAKAFRAFGLPKKRLGCVAVAMGGEPGARNVSWSGIRAAVAVGNALAFAWDAPAVAVKVRGDEPRDEIEAKVRAAAAKARKGDRVAAAYDGEPNITTPKSL